MPVRKKTVIIGRYISDMAGIRTGWNEQTPLSMGNRLNQSGVDMIQRLFQAGFAIALLMGLSSVASAEPVDFVGADACKKCHTAEHGVWEGTPHFASFKSIHKNKKAKGILKAIGEKRMKRSETCATCHYSYIGGKAKAGPSCESCHGPAAEWIDIHNDKKNPNNIKDAIAKGMIHSSLIYDIASNCASCHGLANPKLSGETASTMLDNGHPLNPNFELVEYSQGAVRHRFYPPDVTVNKEMTDAQKSVYYLAGQAAAWLAQPRRSARPIMPSTRKLKTLESRRRRAPWS